MPCWITTSLSSDSSPPAPVTVSSLFADLPAALPGDLPAYFVSSLSCTDRPKSNVCGHLDAGSQASTVPHRFLIWIYRPYTSTFPCPIRLISANGDPQFPLGEGTTRIPISTSPGYLDIRTFYTPGIPSYIVSPKSIQEAVGADVCDGYTLRTNFVSRSFLFIAHHNLDSSLDVLIPGSVVGTLNFLHPVVPPDGPSPGSDSLLSPADTRHVQSLTADTTKILWHQRLGHCCDEKLAAAHQYADGVPKFSSTTSVLDQCPVCLASKLRHQPRGSAPTRTATRAFQGLSIDMAFAGQRSKNSDRSVDFTGYGGETCYLLLSDHYTEKLYGCTRRSKVPPVQWLRFWLTKHIPPDSPTDDRYVFMDQGGELYQHTRICQLFEEEFYFTIIPIGTAAHHENGVVERGIQTVDTAIRTMLFGAGLGVSFWPFCFYHYIFLKNAALPKRGSAMSSDERASGKRTDLSRIKIFGCRIWVVRHLRRRGKYVVESRRGRFLGYKPGLSTKNVIWVDDDTGRVKYDYHHRFDEGMNDFGC